jgi:pimeloyl-ACP methyl ester carboxylesterase
MVGADVDNRANPVSFFDGKIDGVRLSTVARYSGDSFDPERRHASDADTALLLNMDSLVGPWLFDESPSCVHPTPRGGAHVVFEREEVSFASMDGLPMTADLYLADTDPETPFIVLFHQAGWSRGEYREIAPRLNALGFNCLAVDLRSGGEVNGVVNETAQRALKQQLGMTYTDALPDLIGSLEFARERWAEGELIAWGSSYSSALVLKVAGDFPELVDAVLAFAPGEYFTRLGKSETWVAESAAKITCPVFITSAKAEQQSWQSIFDAIPAGKNYAYLPETAGNHGSRALWSHFDDSAGYWSAVERFLEEL